MIVEFIPEKCWCNETKYNVLKKGIWFDNTQFELGKCIKCGTVRTISTSATKEIEYNETIVYSNILSLRHRNSLKTIVKYVQNGNLLDIGCSSGGIIEAISKKRRDVSVDGIDLNIKAIQNPVSVNISIQYMGIESVKNKYNNIIALHVLEHIPDLEIFFDEIKRISKSSVTYYFAVPNIYSYSARHRLTQWGALNPLQHSWHFSKETFSAMLLHFLPDTHLVVSKTSWIWPFRKLFYRNILYQGDQVEAVVLRK